MKKLMSMILLTTIIVTCLSICSFPASAESITTDYLYERTIRGDRQPTQKTDLPYTASWNSVISYTNTNYYFTG